MVRRKEDRIKIGKVACVECGHCVAICPQGAIRDEEGAALEPSPPAQVSPENLGALIRRRRTVRSYEAREIPREVLDSVLDVTRWTPTAANCQAQEFLVVTEPAVRQELRRRIEAHYRELAQTLAVRQHRAERVAALGMDPGAATHPHMLAAVPAFVKAIESGRDRLFFEAPVVIVVHAAPEQVMPEMAAHFATMLLVLMAEAHGLGTCISGYASDALQVRADIRQWLGIPPANQVHDVIILGWPAERFLGIPARQAAKVQWR